MRWCFGREEVGDLDRALSREWLLGNGLGGFAFGTTCGLNTRRYHGLLVAAKQPPGERWLLVNKLDEEVTFDGETFKLGSNDYGGVLEPMGFLLQHSFCFDGTARFVYACRQVLLEKRVVMVQGANVTLVEYRQLSGPPVHLKVRLLANARSMHGDMHANSAFNTALTPVRDGFLKLAPFPQAPALCFRATRGEFLSDSFWVYNMFYRQEAFRGLQPKEDVYSPGYFEGELRTGERMVVALAAETPVEGDLEQLFDDSAAAAVQRWEGTEYPDFDPFAKALAAAAATFRCKDARGRTWLIAGYPWFGAWGRDTYISLPGLTLVTGHFDEARSLLETGAAYVDEGMVPNLLDEQGTPHYNTLDASFWYVWAAQKYLQYTADYEFARKTLWPALREIFAWHLTGTRYGIRAEEDGLIAGGSPDTQLTWMDAKFGDWVVTPRHGKPVEINALWYNALRFAGELAERLGEPADQYRELAEKVYYSFNQQFWNPQAGCLYDVVRAGEKDASLRPNQVLACALPYPVLDGPRSKAVVDVVWRNLWTSLGLRTLSPDDPHYVGQYGGDQASRDGAYHRGTVWPWLFGPFVSAFRRVYQHEDWYAPLLKEGFAAYEAHLAEAGIGFISEIFTGDAPHWPRGCPAQGWSVAEVLRAYTEDYLQVRPGHK